MEATAHITANIHITTINFFASGHDHDVAQEMQSIIFVLVSAGAMYVITPLGIISWQKNIRSTLTYLYHLDSLLLCALARTKIVTRNACCMEPSFCSGWKITPFTY